MKRLEIEIIRSILYLRTGRKTDFVASTRTSTAQINKYLRYLVTHRFLEEKPSSRRKGPVYSITPKGKKLFHILEAVLHLLRPPQEI